MTERTPITTPTVPGGLPFDATQIQFTQSGTGAVARSVQDKLRELLTSADNPTIGVGNTAIGVNALRSATSADENTAFGWNALASITSTNGVTGRHNVAFGSRSLTANTSGRQNCAIGNQTLELNTTGSNNVAVGNGALDANVVSDGNTAVGVDALRLATGTLNTAFGVTALGNLGNASGNHAFGAGAGLNCLTGSDNLFLGHFAGGYETGSNAFYVDNQDRTNTAGDKAKALIYGTFAATADAQMIQFNARTAIGATILADAQLFLGGTLTGATNAQGLAVATTLVVPAGGVGLLQNVAGTINKAGSGTHADFASVYLQPPTIGAGAATLTNATTLKITGAPSTGTNQRALWVAAGNADFDVGIRLIGATAPVAGASQVGIGGGTQTTIGANGAASALTANPLGYLKINVAGTTAIIPYYNS